MSFAVVPVRTLYNVCLTPPLHEGFRGGARRLDLDDPDATTRYMVYYNHIRDIFQSLLCTHSPVGDLILPQGSGEKGQQRPIKPIVTVVGLNGLMGDG